MKVLIVKSSSFGDIVQSFYILQYLKDYYKKVEIDWVCEHVYFSLLKSHPLINSVISFKKDKWKKNFFQLSTWKEIYFFLRKLRKKKYDVLFDLQGNCKSGFITFFSKAKDKVGFDIYTAREKLNVLATNKRYKISKKLNISLFYLRLVQSYYARFSTPKPVSFSLKLNQKEKGQLLHVLRNKQFFTKYKIMVCMGSRWNNKCLTRAFWQNFLSMLNKKFEVSYLLVWGTEKEKKEAESLQGFFPTNSLVLERLNIASWQNLMKYMDLILAVDSSALHLCSTTNTPSFSFFGPTNLSVFKPQGDRHGAFQGVCPYNIAFEKQCPYLRSCKTGSCTKDLTAQEAFPVFNAWFEKHCLKSHKLERN